MILTCPACDRAYFADDASIGREGRQITCESCGHAWHEQGEAAASSEEALTRGAHERYLDAVRLRRKARAKTTAIVIWGTLIAFLSGAAVTATLMRNDLARAWPESASVFRAAGLEVNRFGVDFENIQRSRELQGTVPVLTVSADVRNVTKKSQPAPLVRVGLLDDFDREVAHLFATVEPASIPAGSAARFSAVLENPPPDSYRLDLRFVTHEEADLPESDAPAEARTQ